MQLRDIDLANPAIDNFDTTRGWLPIGSLDNSTYSGNPFVGHYDGNYRKITGLYIERPDEDCVGLFGCVAGDCYVKNMIIEGTSITGNDYVGSVVGCYEYDDVYVTAETDNAHFCMENIANYVTVRGGYNTGGLIGSIDRFNWFLSNYSVVSCKNNGNVYGKGLVGGIIGDAIVLGENLSITNCRFTGSVTAGEDCFCIGGIAGSVTGKVTDCLVEGIICASATSGYYCGGLIGSASGDISNCKFSGSVFSEMPDNTSHSDEKGTGGLIGGYYGGSISGCFVENATIEGSGSVGGLVGNVSERSYWDYYSSCNFVGCLVKNSSVKSKSGGACGGLVGHFGLFYYDECDAIINNCIVENSNITGGTTGGLVGVASQFKSIENSNVNNVNVEGVSAAGLVGCLRGDYGGIVSNCSVISDKLLGYYEVGGFVAYNISDYTNIKDCFVKIKSIENNGETSDSYGCYTGGFVAYNEGNISNCRCSVDEIKSNLVLSDLYMGGFAGLMVFGRVDNCYTVCGSIECGSSNAVEYFADIGGFAGAISGDFFGDYGSEIANCYVKSNSVISTIPDSQDNPCTSVGGFIGSGSNYVTITNCYADIAKVEGNGSLASFWGGIDNRLEEPYSLDCNSSFVTKGELPFTDNEFVNVSNCYTLPNGYDSSKDWGDHPWDPTIWNLQDGALPTLKGLPEN